MRLDEAHGALTTALSALEPDAAGVVIGAGKLGHLAVACREALTGAFVIAVDRDPAAPVVAERMGVDLCWPSDGTTAGAIRDATRGDWPPPRVPTG